MDVSIIIITYNTRQMTCDCIQSILSQKMACSYEIILVDNASQDDSKEFFSKFYGITYIYNPANYGFGKANNIGAKAAKGKYLFFLNSDTLFVNNALDYFVDFMKSFDAEVMLGCELLDKDKKKIDWTVDELPTPYKTIKMHIRNKLHLSYINEKNNPPYDVEYIVGASMFIPASIWQKYGGFDERYFMYYEESDMQLRYARKGVRRVIIPGPQIIHLEGKTAKSFSIVTTLYNYKSSMIYFKKNFSRLSYYYFRCAFALITLSTLPISGRYAHHREKIFKAVFQSISL